MQRVKYLAQIVLQGEPKWEWFPVLLARVSMGLFFAISGWNKLFTVAHWKGLLAAMIATGLPFPKLMAMFLASIEFYGGALLTIGFMSTFFSIALAFAMIVAIVTVEIPFVIPPGLGPLDWLDWFLYLPQVLYVIIFLWLIVKGPGPYSIDAMIARKLGVDRESDLPRLGLDKDSDEDANKDPDMEADEESNKGFGLGLPTLLSRWKDSGQESDNDNDNGKGSGSGGTSWTPQNA
ncbi:MAG: DoxX family protein [Gammaproteobacteria bacterium]|nr:DoxX family protein [Gammaproteobacteria bacterium]